MAQTRKKKTVKGKRRTKKQQQAYNAAMSALLFGASALVAALTYIEGENLWADLQGVFFGLFGACLYLLAPLFLYLAFFAAKGEPLRPKAVQAGVMLALCSAFWHVLFAEIPQEGTAFGAGVQLFYDIGTTHKGGGAIASFIAWPLLTFFGRIATLVTLFVFIVIAVMLLTGITPNDITDFIKNRAGDAKEAFTPPPRPQAAERLAAKPARTAGAGDAAGIDIDLGPAAAGRRKSAAPEPIEPFPIIPPGPVTPAGIAATPPAPDKHLEEIIRAATGAMATAITKDEQETAPAAPAAPANTTLAEKIEFVAGAPATYGHEAAYKQADNTVAVAALPSSTTAAPTPKVEGFAVGPDGQVQRPPYVYPPITLFEKPVEAQAGNIETELKRTADLLVSTLASFGVQTKILDISRGPAVTRYELQPQAGVKISRITNLADDIALALASAGVRIEAPIPNKAAVGIEVPNKDSASVRIRSIFESPVYKKMGSPLTLPLGKDIAGNVQVADLTRMPHLLVAGSTGSGKSVCINGIITSILHNASPEEAKMILIDPKVVELAEYNGVPHLLMPVVTEPRKAAGALGTAVGEMEKRYRLFAENNVRDIKSYNALAAASEELKTIPYIAIIIDELADLMMVAGKDVEDYICRLAQKARAAGMHLVVATQRPSVDVITGLIKANIPSRIAFAVSSQIDSRTILDGGGAEKLLGMGDMLFLPVGAAKPARIQGAYVTDAEIARVIAAAKQGGSANYDEEMIADMEKQAVGTGGNAAGSDDEDAQDPMFLKAVEVVVDAGMASTSLLQRRLKLGYARAARIMDEMEQMHVIGPYEGSKPRQVLLTRSQFVEMAMNTTPEEV